jgi:hypothetical protein
MREILDLELDIELDLDIKCSYVVMRLCVDPPLCPPAPQPLQMVQTRLQAKFPGIEDPQQYPGVENQGNLCFAISELLGWAHGWQFDAIETSIRNGNKSPAALVVYNFLAQLRTPLQQGQQGISLDATAVLAVFTMPIRTGPKFF